MTVPSQHSCPWSKRIRFETSWITERGRKISEVSGPEICIQSQFVLYPVIKAKILNNISQGHEGETKQLLQCSDFEMALFK